VVDPSTVVAELDAATTARTAATAEYAAAATTARTAATAEYAAAATTARTAAAAEYAAAEAARQRTDIFQKRLLENQATIINQNGMMIALLACHLVQKTAATARGAGAGGGGGSAGGNVSVETGGASLGAETPSDPSLVTLTGGVSSGEETLSGGSLTILPAGGKSDSGAGGRAASGEGPESRGDDTGAEGGAAGCGGPAGGQRNSGGSVPVDTGGVSPRAETPTGRYAAISPAGRGGISGGGAGVPVRGARAEAEVLVVVGGLRLVGCLWAEGVRRGIIPVAGGLRPRGRLVGGEELVIVGRGLGP
jgi:hypothetical protein